MSNVDHPVAVYIVGVKAIEIKQKDIADEQEMKDEKDWVLTKTADEMSAARNLFTPDLRSRLEFRNAAINGKRNPCFALVPSKVTRNLVLPAEYPTFRDDRHDFRVTQLCDQLNSRKAWDVKVGDFKNERTILELNGYVWTTETTRIYRRRGGIVRHDIVGQQPGNRLLSSCPAVAIEVVNTHWLAQQSMNDMLFESRKSTLLVFFDLLEKFGAALKIFDELGVIKPAMYFDGGRVCRDEVERRVLKSPSQPDGVRITKIQDLQAEMVAVTLNAKVITNWALENYEKRK